MCGIIGFVIKKDCSKSDEYKKKFLYYLNHQTHRGPDYQEKKVILNQEFEYNLGFNRLSIVDLNKDSNKIFCNENYVLLFNGEIYNHKFLLNKYLKDKNLETKTDTEVLFELLVRFKSKIINELEGMFSFVLVDIKNNKVLLSKDYTGIKPLYYLKNTDGIFFASEAWFLYSLSQKKLDSYSCKHFFQFGFSPLNKTLIESVNKILPGTYSEFCSKKNKLVTKRYNEIKKEKSFPNLNNQLIEDKIKNIINKNLISDTKVGIFLSGGIDSSIATIIAKEKIDNIEAYTSYFHPNSKYSKFNQDFEYAKKLCDSLNIKLNKVKINDTDQNQKALLFSAIKRLDEPLSNLNFFNSFLQSKEAKNDNCKVILTGDGADEIFGGYDRYKKCWLARKFKFLSIFNSKIKKINNLQGNQIPLYFYNLLSLNKNEKIFSKEFYETLKQSEEFNFDLPSNTENVDVINYFDITHWLSEESNFKLDRASMLNSIEARVPFQDIDLIKNVFPIQFKYKTDFFSEKKHLKNLNFIPNFIKNRKKKGWFSPESLFLRDYLKEPFFEVFNKKKMIEQNLFDSDQINILFKSHKNGGYFKNELITLFMFQVWYEQMLNS
jgi:asparagine synthase (glutamine-hydrolysing)